MRSPKDYLSLYLKGIAMAAADVVPGASGGTVAFITGIYEELIFSIRAIDRDAIMLLTRFRLREFWKKINGRFLLILFAGVVTGVFTVSRIAVYLLQHHPIKIWSFFFGVFAIAALLMLRLIRRWSGIVVLSLFLGIVISFVLTVIPPVQTPGRAWFMFIAGLTSGMVALLPGISSTYVLALFGKYNDLGAAFSDLRITAILAFTAGCIAGILSFSRILAFTLKNYHSATVALLAGFLLGSLNKVWPWREVLEYITDRQGRQVPVFDRSILPWNYVEITGKDPQVFQAILLMALGVFIVVLTEKIAERLKTKI